MKQRRGMDDERLRQVLRAGDPLGEGESLDPIAARAMRRRVLAAADSAPRLGWGAVAVLATAGLAVAAGVMLWLPNSPAVEDRVAEEPAAEATGAEESIPAVAQAEEARTEAPPATKPEPELVLADRSPSAPQTPRPTDLRVAAEAPVVPLPVTGPRVAAVTNAWDEERPRHRQIQLTTAGGTQIIWILNADASL